MGNLLLTDSYDVSLLRHRRQVGEDGGQSSPQTRTLTPGHAVRPQRQSRQSAQRHTLYTGLASAHDFTRCV